MKFRDFVIFLVMMCGMVFVCEYANFRLDRCIISARTNCGKLIRDRSLFANIESVYQ